MRWSFDYKPTITCTAVAVVRVMLSAIHGGGGARE